MLEKITLNLHDLRLSGLNTFTALLPLQPTSSTSLATSVGLASLVLDIGVVVTTPQAVNAAAAAALAAAPPVTPVLTGGSYDVVLNVSKMALALATTTVLDRSAVANLRVSQLGSPGCLLSAFDALKLETLGLQVERAVLVGTPVMATGSAAAFRAAQGLPFGGDDLLDDLLDDKFAPGEGFNLDLGPLIDKLLSPDSKHSGALVNSKLLAPKLAAANATCRNLTFAPSPIVDPTFDDDMMDVDVDTWELGLGLGSALIVALVLAACAHVSISSRSAARARQTRASVMREVHADYSPLHSDGVAKTNSSDTHDSQRATLPTMHSSLVDLGLARPSSDERASARARYQSVEAGMASGDRKGDEVNTLWESPKLSRRVVWGVPLTCVGLAALFISANTTMGAEVYAVMGVGPLAPVQTDAFFSFTLQNSVQDMWDAKVYPLSILIAVFSGAWPYGKLLLIGYCWCRPMRVGTRETLLQWLDALGKWSLLDSYVMVCMMVAFNFKIYLGPGAAGDEPIQVTIFTKPGYGFYSFLVATMGGLAIGHMATFFHRYAGSPLSRIPAGGPCEATVHHLFKNHPTPGAEHGAASGDARGGVAGAGGAVADDDDDDDDSDVGSANAETLRATAAKLSAKVRFGVPLLLVVTFVTLMAGAFAKSFVFEFGGLTGWILETKAGPGSTPQSTSYSLVSTYDFLPESAPHPCDFGVHFIQQMYLVYALVVPAFHLALLLCAWLVPMTLRTQAAMLAVGEVANAWSAVDVFIFSIFAALMQLGQFCAFVVEKPCGSPIAALGGMSINDLVTLFFKAEDIDEAHTCLTVGASLIGGCYPLFAAGVSIFLTSQLVLGYMHRSVHDRIDDLLLADAATAARVLAAEEADYHAKQDARVKTEAGIFLGAEKDVGSVQGSGAVSRTSNRTSTQGQATTAL